VIAHAHPAKQQGSERHSIVHEKASREAQMAAEEDAAAVDAVAEKTKGKDMAAVARARNKARKEEEQQAKVAAAQAAAQSEDEATRAAALAEEEAAVAARVLAEKEEQVKALLQEKVKEEQRAEEQRADEQQRAEEQRAEQRRASDAEKKAQEEADAAKVAQEEADAAKVAQEEADAAKVALASQEQKAKDDAEKKKTDAANELTAARQRAADRKKQEAAARDAAEAVAQREAAEQAEREQVAAKEAEVAAEDKRRSAAAAAAAARESVVDTSQGAAAEGASEGYGDTADTADCRFYIALYDWVGEDSDEDLQFAADDVLQIRGRVVGGEFVPFDPEDESFYIAEFATGPRKGERGVVPSNYIEIMQPAEQTRVQKFIASEAPKSAVKKSSAANGTAPAVAPTQRETAMAAKKAEVEEQNEARVVAEAASEEARVVVTAAAAATEAPTEGYGDTIDTADCQLYVALHDWVGEDAEEDLQFAANDVLQVRGRVVDGEFVPFDPEEESFYNAEIATGPRKGERGAVPSNFIEVMSASEQARVHQHTAVVASGARPEKSADAPLAVSTALPKFDERLLTDHELLKAENPRKVYVLHDYDPHKEVDPETEEAREDADDELSLFRGEFITMVSQIGAEGSASDGFFLGLDKSGAHGLVPSNFVTDDPDEIEEDKRAHALDGDSAFSGPEDHASDGEDHAAVYYEGKVGDVVFAKFDYDPKEMYVIATSFCCPPLPLLAFATSTTNLLLLLV
jgi:hypothetical protein